MAYHMSFSQAMRLMEAFFHTHRVYDPEVAFQLLVRYPHLLQYQYPKEINIIFTRVTKDLTEEQWKIISERYLEVSSQPNTRDPQAGLSDYAKAAVAASPYPWLHKGAAAIEAGSGVGRSMEPKSFYRTTAAMTSNRHIGQVTNAAGNTFLKPPKLGSSGILGANSLSVPRSSYRVSSSVVRQNSLPHRPKPRESANGEADPTLSSGMVAPSLAVWSAEHQAKVDILN